MEKKEGEGAAKKHKTHRILSAFAQIQYPTHGEYVALPSNSFTSVNVFLPNDPDPVNDTVFVKVYPYTPGFVPPTQPPQSDNTVVQLKRKGTSSYFDSNTVPVPVARIGAKLGDPSDDLVVAWPKIQGQYQALDTSDFIAGCPSSAANVVIPATACIWFTWALPGFPKQQHGEQDDATGTYRPVPFIVPADATHLNITTFAGTSWCHEPGKWSGPEGMAPSVALEDIANYQNPTLLSQNIVGNAAIKCNRLVGLWGKDPTVATQELDIGTGTPTPLSFVRGANYRLFLAFHDGKDWADNSGTAQVTVTWS